MEIAESPQTADSELMPCVSGRLWIASLDSERRAGLNVVIKVERLWASAKSKEGIENGVHGNVKRTEKIK